MNHDDRNREMPETAGREQARRDHARQDHVLPPPDAQRFAAAPPISPFDVPPMAPVADERNTLGMVAFIAAIAGFCVPALPSLFALVAGAIALRRRPRGFAIAAVVVSVAQLALGTLVLAMVVKATASSRSRARTIVSSSLAQTALEEALAAEAADGVDRFPIGAPAVFTATDAWGVPFRVEVVVEDGRRRVSIWSAGDDREFDTADDFLAASDGVEEDAPDEPNATGEPNAAGPDGADAPDAGG